MIDTISSNDKGMASWLESWRQLRAQGWDVTVLVAPDKTKLIGLASRGSIEQLQLELTA